MTPQQRDELRRVSAILNRTLGAATVEPGWTVDPLSDEHTTRLYHPDERPAMWAWECTCGAGSIRPVVSQAEAARRADGHEKRAPK